MFQSLIARSVNLDVLSGGIGGTRNGAIRLVCISVAVCLLHVALVCKS
jgi:hypothetical protein